MKQVVEDGITEMMGDLAIGTRSFLLRLDLTSLGSSLYNQVLHEVAILEPHLVSYSDLPYPSSEIKGI